MCRLVGVLIMIVAMRYLDWRRPVALKAGEGYGDPAKLVNEPAEFTGGKLANPFIALQSLILVGVTNNLFPYCLPAFYGDSNAFVPAVVGHAAHVVRAVSMIHPYWEGDVKRCGVIRP